ncbi:membrane protein insertase YidC [Hazenella sp. IB182357]|uniref:Membrane protein insertase YidC n=1 Tax=Polycladospora coralii TaxID=2771432 RepID=A0A926N8B9_9BACL|nr:membrane protein insertase YidC [Polycladospora coralii]MBD1371976.1 membrane protein insertase YidC [Polycladospora coralii]MBS7530480.1 membrane protein insertase YidC [Polycladospora coralii]
MTMVMMAGCVPDTTQFKIDYQNPSLWEKYLVIPLSSLLDLFEQYMGSYGLSIVVVTILIRIAVFPLQWKQQKSTKAMQELQPHILKIREKYKKDQQKLQEETMKLFQAHNVNPMAGCFPILLQIPILFAFYQAIMGNEHIAEASFLYLQLGEADPYYILPLLAAVTTYLQLIATGASDNPQMKIMLFFMPVMIFFLAWNFPSALSLYWVIGNIFTILTYLIFFKKNKPVKA